MKFDWNKFIKDFIKFAVGGLAGWLVGGCASLPVFIF